MKNLCNILVVSGIVLGCCDQNSNEPAEEITENAKMVRVTQEGLSKRITY